MFDPRLYQKVRGLRESGYKESEVMEKLRKRGVAESNIQAALREYEKDESSNADERLIKEIETRYGDGEAIEKIITNLANSNNSVEVHKALLRSRLRDKDHIGFGELVSKKGFLILPILMMAMSLFLSIYLWKLYNNRGFLIISFFIGIFIIGSILISILFSLVGVPRKINEGHLKGLYMLYRLNHPLTLFSYELFNHRDKTGFGIIFFVISLVILDLYYFGSDMDILFYVLIIEIIFIGSLVLKDFLNANGFR